MLMVLGLVCIFLLGLGIAIAFSAEEFIQLIVGILMALFFGLMAFISFNADSSYKERAFQQAIMTKNYETIIVEVQGIYKDKVVANDNQYDLNLNYSETKDVTNLKPSDAVKIVYVKRGSERYIISVEKIK